MASHHQLYRNTTDEKQAFNFFGSHALAMMVSQNGKFCTDAKDEDEIRDFVAGSLFLRGLTNTLIAFNFLWITARFSSRVCAVVFSVETCSIQGKLHFHWLAADGGALSKVFKALAASSAPSNKAALPADKVFNVRRCCSHLCSKFVFMIVLLKTLDITSLFHRS